MSAHKVSSENHFIGKAQFRKNLINNTTYFCIEL